MDSVLHAGQIRRLLIAEAGWKYGRDGGMYFEDHQGFADVAAVLGDALRKMNLMALTIGGIALPPVFDHTVWTDVILSYTCLRELTIPLLPEDAHVARHQVL